MLAFISMLVFDNLSKRVTELEINKNLPVHYSDVILGASASEITSLTMVYSTGYSGVDQRKHQSSSFTGLCAGNSPVTGEFPAQMASNAENVLIWWRHHINISARVISGVAKNR